MAAGGATDPAADAPHPDLPDDPDLSAVRTLAELAAVLRRLRRRQARQRNDTELTVRELAARSGYSYSVISYYLAGKVLPPTDRLDVLVALLGATPAEQGALATARDRVEERRQAQRRGWPIRQLPPVVAGFTGRAEQLARLGELTDAANTSNVVVISAIAGAAGVGKTALAVRWAHQAADRFPDGSLYVDLRGYGPDQPLPATAALAAFLRSLGVDGADLPSDETERAARYRALLSGRRMLILIDNAARTEQVAPLLPGEPDCAVLVTSRDTLPGLIARHGASRIELDPLPLADAVTLLHTLVGDRVAAEPGAAARLADQCDRLPLALRLAADLANTRPGVAIAELADEFTDARHRLDLLDAGGDAHTAVRAVFSWSYRNLPTEVARAFRLIGGYPGQHLDAYTMAALAGTDLADARALLHSLAGAHLVQPAGPNRYGTHDLLRAYAAELAGDDAPADRRTAVSRLLDHYLHTCTMAMDLVARYERDRRPDIPDPGTPAPELTDQPAAIAWLDTERANLIAAAVHAADHGWPAFTSQLSAILLRYLDTGGHYHDAKLLHARALGTAAPADRGPALARLGAAHWRLGHYTEAIDLHQQDLDISQRADDRFGKGRALTNLGATHWQSGHVAKAADCLQQALDLLSEAGDRRGQGRTLANLGNLCWRLGNYPEALNRLRQALDHFRGVGDRTSAGLVLGKIGLVHWRLGRLAEAHDYTRRALACSRETGYRTFEAHALDWLARALAALGHLDEAAEHDRQAIDLLREVGDRIQEAAALSHLATVWLRLGRSADAVDGQEQALFVAQEAGDEHQVTEARNGLGEALHGIARFPDALDQFRQAMAIADKTGDRYELARANAGIGQALAAQGDHGAARAAWQLALARYTELGVPEAGQVGALLADNVFNAVRDRR